MHIFLLICTIPLRFALNAKKFRRVAVSLMLVDKNNKLPHNSSHFLSMQGARIFQISWWIAAYAVWSSLALSSRRNSADTWDQSSQNPELLPSCRQCAVALQGSGPSSHWGQPHILFSPTFCLLFFLFLYYLHTSVPQNMIPQSLL